LPHYDTEKYSLFLLRKEGIHDAFHRVYPPEASTEMYSIETALQKLLGEK
jgi:hypothetical protein